MRDTNYPALKWHPETAECRQFDAANEVPEGWLDMHPSNLPPAAEPAPLAPEDPKPAEPSMTRAEMKAALDAGGISYAKNATPSALYALLHQKLYEVLTARGESVEPGADAKTLLERVNAAE